MPAIVPDVYAATDLQGLERLRAAAAADPKSTRTLREAATQFEALFTQMLLRSMREASFGNDLFESDQSPLYRDLYDQQVALLLARKGLGLADLLVKQLGGDRPQAPATENPAAASAAASADANADGPALFVRRLLPAARAAARELGVTPQTLIAIAAHETGWGRAVPRYPDGRTSHNLFGIKADASWHGARLSVQTLEYEDGLPVRKPQSFRAYASEADSFADFVNFVRANPRYREALAQAHDPQAFIAALARSGYATDPAYRDKVGRILSGQRLQTLVAGLKLSAAMPSKT
jgi:flagellar protein FlgJ